MMTSICHRKRRLKILISILILTVVALTSIFREVSLSNLHVEKNFSDKKDGGLKNVTNFPKLSIRSNTPYNVTKDPHKFVVVLRRATQNQKKVPSDLNLSGNHVTELKDIFISIKTSSQNHVSRLQLLINTWVQQAKNQVIFLLV